MFSLKTAEDPRFRVLNHTESASFSDLIAVILSHGNPGRNVADITRDLIVLARTETGLFQLDPGKILSIAGIGRARGATLIAAIELARRKESQSLHTEQPFSPTITARWLSERFRGYGKEHLVLFSYNSNFRLIRHNFIARGSLDGVSVSYREIIKTLLNDRARFALIAHNHPDETARPGLTDIRSTKKLHALCEELGISLMDHYILGVDGVFSIQKNDFIYR